MTLLLVVMLPLASAAVLAVLGRRIGRRPAGWILIGGLALAFGAAVAIAQAFAAGRSSLVAEIGPWLPLRGADLALRVDPPMVPLLVGITGVSTLIALCSIGSLDREDEASRFGAAFGLAASALLLVIVASDLLLLFAGWELLAVATYLLIGHRRDRAAAAAAATRAFVVARVGDTALFVAILSLFASFHTVDIGEIEQRVSGFAGQPDAMARIDGVLFVPSLLIVIAALARSAQLPFQIWMSDVDHAPSGASALVQSSGAAIGVVLLVRLAPLLHPNALAIAAAIGAITALTGAAIALAQVRSRQVLAWSTVSQVGLMFVAAGTGAALAALFHLLAHAIAKATLIASSDVRATRVTVLALAAGTIALAAVPPAAGYFSLVAVAASASSAPPLLAVVLGTTLLTGIYAARFFVLATRPTAHPASDATRLALVALSMLAAGSLAFGGLVASGLVALGLARAADAAPALALACAVSALVGVGLGIAQSLRAIRVPLPVWLAEAARSGFEFDALYRLSLVSGFQSLARVLDEGTEQVVERAGDLIGELVVMGSTLLGRAQRRYERASLAVVFAAAVALVAYWSLR